MFNSISLGFLPTNKLYLNLETGELLTYEQMRKEAAEEYDIDDPTNCLEWYEYYQLTDYDN